MQGVRGIIFDCDGVLINSRPANLAYYNAVLTQMGVAAIAADDGELSQLCHTAASSQVFAALLGQERVEDAMARAAALDFRQFLPYLTPEPGVSETLGALQKRYPLALATNRTRGVESLLAHFGLDGYFRAVVTSSDVARPKPAPDMLKLAGASLGLEPAELLFVGDSPVDREAARQAGIPFAAYKDGVTGDVSVGSFSDLLTLLGG